MAKVTLRSYVREIESLIEQDQRLEEAISHCRHILKTYPKHLESYRMLGKAYLEGKRYDQAVDIFERVLMAVPSDFVSHVGMSIIADDQGKLDDAIWHMERAFEVQPANAAIQGELQRLFGRRDGVEPPKIRLTRGALAHMYVQGELYTQAISEIRAVLAQDPKRTDLEVLLAKAYFRNGQKSEAAQACSELLVRHPYCLEANRLMAELVAGGQSPSGAAEYRQRVEELDPYAAFAPDSLSQTEAVPDSSVVIERFDPTGRAPEAGFMLGLGTSSVAAGSAARSEPSLPMQMEAAELPVAEPDMPEFLREAGWKLAEDAEGAVEVAGDDAEQEDAALPGDLPDWVRALAPSDGAESTATGESSAVMGSETPAGDDAVLPSWLGAQGGEPVDPDASAPGTSESPAGASEQTVADEGLPGGGADEGMDTSLAWLHGLSAEGEPRAESSAPEAAKAPAAPEPPAPSRTFDRASIERWESSAEEAEGEGHTPAAMPPPEGARAEADQAGGQSLDWLRNLNQDDTYARMEETAEGGEHSGEAPAELTGVRPGPQVGEQPTWLGNEAAGTGPPVAGADGKVDAKSEGSSGLPEWLASLDNAPADVAEQRSSDLPDWLRSESNMPPPDAERVPSADWKPAEQGPASPANSGATEADVRGESKSMPSATPAAAPEKSKPLPRPPKPGGVTLAGAQSELGRGNIAAALDVYGRLIHKGKSVDEIIRDLKDALYRYPVEVPIWQALGDAYMRANRLQEALDAYTKAEELLR